MNRYPDMGGTDLYAALAAKLGVPTSNLALGDRLGRADLPDAAGVLRSRRRGRLRVALLRGLPDRASPRRPRRRCGCRSRPRPPRPRRDGAQRSPTAPGRAGLHPQQPDRAGGDADRAATRSSPQVPSHVLVVVDEAYVEFVRMADAVDGLAMYRDTRTSWSPAPSRRPTGWPNCGSGTPSAPEPLAAALRAVSLPFGVSAVAQAAAVASLAAEAELLERVEALVAERTRVLADCAAGWAGESPTRRATSSGSAWATGRWTSRPPARRPASSYGRSPVTACAGQHRRARGQRPDHRGGPAVLG